MASECIHLTGANSPVLHLVVLPGMAIGWQNTNTDQSRNAVDVKSGSLWKYIKNENVYICPSDVHAHKVIQGSGGFKHKDYQFGFKLFHELQS